MLTFFIALCHALQEEDNELNATDAYWFGLVDEVWGNADLFSRRLFEEFAPDKSDETEPTPRAKEQTADSGACT